MYSRRQRSFWNESETTKSKHAKWRKMYITCNMFKLFLSSCGHTLYNCTRIVAELLRETFVSLSDPFPLQTHEHPNQHKTHHSRYFFYSQSFQGNYLEGSNQGHSGAMHIYKKIERNIPFNVTDLRRNSVTFFSSKTYFPSGKMKMSMLPR